jgi:hypothetical protein
MRMSVTDWFVVAAGAGAIGWICWYFFLAERSDGRRAAAGASAAGAAAPVDGAGEQSATITVHGGDEPLLRERNSP